MNDKPGIKTSEGQLTALVTLLIGAIPVLFPDRFALSPEQQGQFITAIVGVYTLGRSIVKAFGSKA